jgi:hypothetical protein
MAKIQIGDEAYEYDTPEHFTFGELFDVEQKIGADAGPIARAMGSLWICVRRRSPSFEFEALRDVVFDEALIESLQAEEDASPPADGPQAGAKLESLPGGDAEELTGEEWHRRATLAASGGRR